jgi:HEAT repeat protein
MVLGEVGDASIVPQVLHSLQDHSDNVRFEAVRALGKIGGPEAVEYLVRMAHKDPCDFIRREAVRYLRRTGLEYPGILKAALRGLKDPSWQVRVQSARLLSGFQDKNSILPLLKAMADPHWSVRESAEMALLNFGQDAVDSLIEALASPLWTTRFRAARLLGEIGDPRAVPSLKDILAKRGERKSVKSVAEASLSKLEKQAVPG